MRYLYMDVKDQNSTQPSQDVDLAKQYQDILDHYSQELASKTPQVPPESVDNSSPKPIDAPEDPAVIPAAETEDTLMTSVPDDIALTEVPNPPEPVSEEPLSSVPQAESYELPPIPQPKTNDLPLTPQPENDDLPPTPQPENSNLPPAPVFDSQQEVPRQSNIFKYLFFVALFIFLTVCGAIVYTVFLSNPGGTSNPSTSVPKVSDTSPTAAPGNVCQLNDQTYQVNEAFAAADGCNTCTCTPDLTISCTEKACESTSSSSASLKDLKTYTSDEYKFSVQYPSDLSMEINNVDTANYVQLIFNKTSNAAFDISASSNYPINQPKYMNDTVSTGKKNINGISWSLFQLPNKYIGLQNEKNSILYSITYPTSEEEKLQQILSTFKIL